MDERALLKRIAKHPPEIQAQALRGVIAERYRGSLFHTCRDLLGYSDITWYTHGDVFESLEDASTRKLIVMPRGTFKSSIAVIGYPIWCLMRDPNDRILIDSEVYENSKNFLRAIKAHLESEKFTSIFGHWRSGTWNESEVTTALRTEIAKEASITASGIGAGKTGQHYKKIIGDDYNSPKNSETTEQRRKVIQHYKMNTSLLEPDGTMAIVGTRYATDDVIGFILDNEIKGTA